MFSASGLVVSRGWPRSDGTFTEPTAAAFSTGYPQNYGAEGRFRRRIFSLLVGIGRTATLTSSKRGSFMQQKAKPKHRPNQLGLYRRRMRFSQRQVTHLLGHKDSSAWSDYERGDRLPSLSNALRLGIILTIPIEFLFGVLHDELRDQIRAEEERLVEPVQQPLF